MNPGGGEARYWWRVLMLLAGAALLVALWTAGEYYFRATPAVRAPFVPTENSQLAGRALGFLHTLGIFLCGIGGMALGIQLRRRLFDGARSWATNAGDFAILLVTLLLIIPLWMYGYVPLVDWLWEACGGEMVPYRLFDVRAQRRRGALDHKWGEQAALLLCLAALFLPLAVNKLRAMLKTSPKRRR